MRRSEHVLDRVAVAEGDSVFKQGDPGNRAFVVQEGRIEIFRHNADGEEVSLGSIERGGIFGELALIDDQPRMANARATLKSTLIVVSRAVIQQKFEQCDPFVKALIGILASNVRSLAKNQLPAASVEPMVEFENASFGATRTQSAPTAPLNA